MCTAVTYKTRDHYFGRNLDLELSYGEQVVITPRNYRLAFRHVPALETHCAMIGVAVVAQDYPLYFEGVNEKGLGMAGLNFPGNADYKEYAEGKDNVTPFEFIPWILGQCGTVTEAKGLLGRINLLKENFSEKMPLSPLHWIISDRECSITVECVKEGLKIYENPMGVLTNNPPFDFHMLNLSNYLSLSREEPTNRFAEKLKLETYSRGMGAMGLPGDLSSASRFVRACFTKLNSVSGDSEGESVSQFFHILDSVAQTKGCAHLGRELYEKTVYSVCCNTDQGIFYYKTYDNSQITAVDLHRENLDGEELTAYPMILEQQIRWQN